MVAFSVRHFPDHVESWQYGEHCGRSHDMQLKGSILSEKQNFGVQWAVRSAPLMTGSAVHANMKNFSLA
jgi:uncharacterized protein